MKLPGIGATRIGVRIYLVSAGSVLVALVGLVAALRLASEPRRDLGLRFSAYPARQLALRWPSTAAVREELERIRDEGGELGVVFRWDGTLVASSGPTPPPLSSEELRALRAAGTLSRRGPARERWPAAAFVLGDPAAPDGYVLLGPGHLPPPPLRELVPLAIVLVGLAVAATLLGRSIARPLSRLARTAQQLGRGDLGARTGIARQDELGEVARAFDDMASRIVDLIHSQTELIANVAHELRTPLARIRVALDLAEDGDASVARTSLAEITEDLGELERLVDDVLASARMELAAGAPPGAAPTLHRARVQMGDLLCRSAERFRHRHPDRILDLHVEDGLPWVDGDPVLLRRAVENLLDNAHKYSSASATIVLRAVRSPSGIEVQVEDRGEGISPQDLERLFTPFFRADPSRTRRTGGVGLGLSLSRRIAEAHGGTLVARSLVGVGTIMSLTLPASTCDSATARAGTDTRS